MRTTVDLDKSLLRRLRIEARKRGVTVKELLATLLQRGLEATPDTPRPYRAPTFDMGTPRVTNFDKALGLAATLEDEEIARELALRK